MQITLARPPLPNGSRAERIGAIRNRKQIQPNPTAVAIMRQILLRLSPRDRSAFEMYYSAQRTQEETCEALGMGIGYFRELRASVRSQFAAAISQPVASPLGDLVHAANLHTRGAGA